MSVEPLCDVVTGEVIDVAMTPAEARTLTDEIRQTLHVGHDLIVEAFRRSAWAALGYDSWDAYCQGEFAGARMVRLDREQRREIVAEMRQAGMSSRAIASGLGVSQNTVLADNQLTQSESVAEPTPITGVNGKTYRPPAPRPQPEIAAPAPKRRPLTDAFFDASFDLAKVVERIERLCADDRFPQNADQVAAKHRSDLVRASEALARVLDRLP